MIESAHTFGGFWTELKLEAVEEYLKLYTKALAPQGFDLWYVDGFAGTGERTEERIAGGFLGEPTEMRVEVFAGSAKRALAVRPPFNHFIFIEKLRERCEALEQLKPQHRDADIRIIRGDANAELRAMVAHRPWSLRDRGSARGVVFLDPYAMHVEWSTLLALAGTRVLDVWYLFPLQAVLRNLARDQSRIASERRLDLVLGSEWRDLYTLPDPRKGFLWVDERDAEPRREATKRQVEAWFHERLQSVFEYASEPLPILTTQGRHDFSLFLAVANPSRKAVNLARKFAAHVTKTCRPKASRRQFGR